MHSRANSMARVLKFIGALIPVSAACFVLYWLEYGQIWTLQTPHRGKI